MMFRNLISVVLIACLFTCTTVFAPDPPDPNAPVPNNGAPGNTNPVTNGAPATGHTGSAPAPVDPNAAPATSNTAPVDPAKPDEPKTAWGRTKKKCMDFWRKVRWPVGLTIAGVAFISPFAFKAVTDDQMKDAEKNRPKIPKVVILIPKDGRVPQAPPGYENLPMPDLQARVVIGFSIVKLEGHSWNVDDPKAAHDFSLAAQTVDKNDAIKLYMWAGFCKANNLNPGGCKELEDSEKYSSLFFEYLKTKTPEILQLNADGPK